MNQDELKEVLNNPAVSAEQKQQALQHIGEHIADPVARLEAELLQTLAKPDLASVSYFDVHRFCSDRTWRVPAVRSLYDRWLDAFLASDNGQAHVEEIASHLRKHDFNDWKNAADEWLASGWKSTARLISALERITANRGNYHSAETVEGAAKFLVEIKRRAGEGQP